MDKFEAPPRTVAVDPWLARGCVFSGIALAIYGATAHWVAGGQVWRSLSALEAGTVAAALAATLSSLLLRGARWHTIIGRLGYQLPWLLQFRVYLSGLALSSTPGKLGETARSLLLRPRGVAYADSLAAFVCERLADVVGIAALGAIVAMLSGRRQAWLEVIACVCLIGSLAVAALLRARRARPLPTPRRWIAAVALTAAAWADLWRGRRVGAYLVVAGLAYGIQGLVFAGFVREVHAGVDASSCLVMFVNATLIGAASMVPGGLGTMDAALVLQLQSVGVPTHAALAASIATRVCTLWFAWALGVLALLTFSTASA